MRIELNCGQCGGNRFNYPVKLTDESILVCEDCGHEIGTVAEMQRKVLDQLAEAERGDAEARP